MINIGLSILTCQHASIEFCYAFCVLSFCNSFITHPTPKYYQSKCSNHFGHLLTMQIDTSNVLRRPKLTICWPFCGVLWDHIVGLNDGRYIGRSVVFLIIIIDKCYHYLINFVLIISPSSRTTLGILSTKSLEEINNAWLADVKGEVATQAQAAATHGSSPSPLWLLVLWLLLIIL